MWVRLQTEGSQDILDMKRICRCDLVCWGSIPCVRQTHVAVDPLRRQFVWVASFHTPPNRATRPLFLNSLHRRILRRHAAGFLFFSNGPMAVSGQGTRATLGLWFFTSHALRLRISRRRSSAEVSSLCIFRSFSLRQLCAIQKGGRSSLAMARPGKNSFSSWALEQHGTGNRSNRKS